MGRRGLWVALGMALLGGVMAPSAADARRARKPKKPVEPPPLTDAREITLEQLNAWVAELAPLVAEAAGRPFTTVPYARFGTALDLERILEAEARLVLARMYDAPSWVLDRMAADARASSPGVLGKYGIETKVLYLSTEAIAGTIEGGAFPPEETAAVARLVLAHELVHALQDQQSDMLPRFASQRDLDALNAFRALTEGHANFVEEKVAEKLGLTEVHTRMNLMQGWDEEGPQVMAAWPIWAIYGQGRVFVGWHHAAGGDDRVWTLLGAPPASTTMIFRPETYATELPEGPDLVAALDGVEERLTDGAWSTISTVIAEYDLREETLSVEGAEDALARLVRGHGVRAMRDDRDAEVRILDFDSPESARAWVEIQRDHATSAAEGPSGGLGLGVSVTPYTRVPSDLGVELVVGPPGSDLSALERRTVWTVRGARIVEVHVARFRPGRRMDAALELVWERLSAQ